MIKETLTKTENLGNDLSVMICIHDLYIWIKSWWSEIYIVLMQHQTFYIKTHVGFTVAGNITFPYKHWFATLNVFVWLTVNCSLTTYTKFIFIFPLQQWKENARNCYVTGLFISLCAILISYFYVVCLVLGVFAKLRKATCSIVMSFSRPHDTRRLLLDGFWWSLIYEVFSKMWLEGTDLVKIWQE